MLLFLAKPALFPEDEKKNQWVSSKDLFQKADGLVAFKSSGKPFTGTSFSLYPNGKPYVIQSFKDGRQHGLKIEHYENGAKAFETFWRNHMPVGELSWSEAGNLIGRVAYAKGVIEYTKTLSLMLEITKDIRNKVEPGHIDISLAFRNLSKNYFTLGRGDDGIKSLELALENAVRGFGNEHPFVANSLSHLGGAVSSLGQHEKAIQYHRKALVIINESFGANHAESISHHWNLGISFSDLREFSKAIFHFKTALDIVLDQKEQNWTLVFKLRNMLGRCHEDLGNSNFAIDHLEEALRISKTEFDMKNDDLEDVYLFLSTAYISLGNEDKGSSYLEQALRMSLAKFSPTDPKLASVYLKIGEKYRRRNDSYRSFFWLNKALDLVKSQKPSVELAVIFNNMGLTHAQEGEHFKAIHFLELSREISRDILKENDPAFVSILGNLSSSYLMVGEHKKAEQLASRQLIILEKVFGKQHQKTAYAYNNLALVHSFAGNADKAIYFAEEFLEVVTNPIEKILGLSNLGIAYTRNGEPELGIKYSRKALDLCRKRLGVNHPNAIQALWGIAEGMVVMGKIEEAISGYEKAFEISSSNRAEGHPEVFSLERDLALLNFIFGERAQAVKQEVSAIKNQQVFVAKNFRYLDSIKRLRFLSQNEPFSILGTIGSTAELAEAIMQWKGIVLDSLIEENLKSDANFNRLDDRDFLSNFLNGKNSALGEDEEIRDSLRTFELNAFSVLNSLNEDSVLVELIKYRKWKKSKKFESEFHYGAMLYLKSKSNDGSAKLVHDWVELGPSKEVDDFILKFRSSIKRSGIGSKTLLSSIGRSLFLPMKSRIPDETKTLIICPDAELNFVPFPALIDEDGKFLCEKYEILNVSAGRDLVFGNETQTKSKKVILFADPSFEGKSVNEGNALALREVDRNATRDLSFAPLAGTRVEAEQISKMITAKGFLANARTGLAATEESLRKVKSPKILHLATHGFFIPGEEKKENKNPLASFNEQNRPAGPISNPMHRSGLALTGAKQTLRLWKEGKSVDPHNDGVLTAEEASALDLTGTWLTVLSACDTGSGVARAGEGVLGLRRAFAMAGTQNLLLTLWPVSDSFTKDFMVSFYEEALKTGDAPRAMAKVQREWLVKLREERSISQAVKLAGPFVLTFRGGLN